MGDGDHRLEVRLLTDAASLAPVTPAWSRLATGSDAVFQSPEFGLGWLEDAGEMVDARAAVFVATLAGRLAGVLPTCVARRGGFRMLTWLGGFASVDAGGLLCDEDVASRTDVACALLNAARRSRRGMLHLHNVRDDVPERPVYEESLRAVHHDVAPYVSPRASDDAEFRRRLSGGHMARRVNRMQADGPVEVVRVAADHPRLPEWFDVFVELRRRRFAALGLTSPLQDDRLAGFYRRQLAVNAAARFDVLLFHHRLAAASFAFQSTHRCYGVISAFDADLAAYSPSTVLLGAMLRDVLDSGRTFELGVGAEPYKLRWATGVAGLTTYLSAGLRGRAYLAARAASHRLRPRSAPTADG